LKLKRSQLSKIHVRKVLVQQSRSLSVLLTRISDLR
jgi:hypothetical protein